MGLSGAAVFALLTTFVLGAAGILADAALRGQRDMADAGAAQAEHGRVLRTGDIRVVNRTFTNPGGPGTPGVLELWVSNTGGAVLDVLRVDVLLDGVLRNDKVAQRSVDGAATAVWAPGEQLYLKLIDLPSTAPARAWVVAGAGATGVG